VDRKKSPLDSFLMFLFIGFLSRFLWGLPILFVLLGLSLLLRSGRSHALALGIAFLLVCFWVPWAGQKSEKPQRPQGAIEGWTPTEQWQILEVSPFLLTERLSGDSSGGWYIQKYRPQDLREELFQGIQEKLQGLGDYAALAQLLILGRTSDRSPLTSWYRDHGLGHLLALSGFHIGVYLILFQMVFRRRFFWPLLAFLWAYLWLIGFIPSFVRAALMISLRGLAQRLGFGLRGLPLLAAAFLLQIVLLPEFTPGFWLSYTAVFALSLFGWSPPKSWGLGGKILQYLWSYATVIGSLSLLSLRFPFLRFPLAGILLMPIATAEVTGVLLMGLSSLLLPTPMRDILGIMLGLQYQLLAPLRLVGWRLDLAPEALSQAWLVFLGLYTKVKVFRRFWPARRSPPLEAPIAYDSPGQIKAFLESQGLNTLKRWGQNFLINKGARDKIQRALELAPEEGVWEIGPGLGAMTFGLLSAGHGVKAFEIDPAYADILENWYGPTGRFDLVRGDVIKTWKEQVPPTGLPPILGNLPYNAASAIIADLIESELDLSPMVVTVQKEMAERMLAKKNTKAYSSFSLLCQSAFRISSLGDLRAGSFFPPPRVDSTILKLEPIARAGDYGVKTFSKLVRGLFTSRRKTIRNNLASAARALGIEKEELGELLEQQGIDLSLRPEAIYLEQYQRAASSLSSINPRDL
jgi:16S rRNA (adenine1518-N6/adenine1519-N6)-dimethyltransferase